MALGFQLEILVYLSGTSEILCMKYWLTACSKHAKEKCVVR